jgi:hypothetical protein
VTDESHRDAMNHAIRAQRERGNIPKSMLPPEDAPPLERVAREPAPPAAEPKPERKKSFVARLLGRQT